jgi:DNA polymerase III subunit delta
LILQTLEELGNDLRTSGLRSVYVILGSEQYQCLQAINLLKSKALAPESGAFDFSEFCAGEDSIDSILEAANTYPMMSKKRVALVTSADKLSDSEQETLVASLKSISPRGLLILLAEDLDHRKKLYKTIRETACVAEFSRLKGFALERWAEAFLQKEGYQISSTAMKKILDLAGADLQSLSTELGKLILFAGKQKKIPDSAIEDLVRNSRQHKIFELLDAIGVRDRKGALRMLDSLLAAGEVPIRIVAMMARHCRQMLIARECLSQRMDAREIAAKLQLLPFLVGKFMRQVRSADPAAIQEIYIRLADIDRRLKSSSADGRLLLEQVICILI